MKAASKPLLIGHRGALALAPENTLASFQKALDHHVDIIETDVRVTADGVAIISHDPEILLSDGSSVIICKTAFDEIQAKKPEVVTLHDMIGFVDRQTRLMIEIKPKVPTGPVVQIIKKYLKHGWQADDFIFASFDFNVLQDVRAALPDIEIVVLERWSGVRATSRARRLKTNKLCMNQRWLWRGFIHSIAGKYDLYAYTLNNAKRARRLESYGLRGIVTDHPDYYEPANSAILPTYESNIPPHRPTHKPHYDVLVPAAEPAPVHRRTIH